MFIHLVTEQERSCVLTCFMIFLYNLYDYFMIFLSRLSFTYTVHTPKNFNLFSVAFSGSFSTFLLIPSLISELLLPLLNFS